MHFPRGCFSSTIDRSSELVHKKATPRRRELRSFGWRLEWSLYLHILFIILILILILILIIYIYTFTPLFIDFFCEHITSIHTFNFTQIMHMHGILYIHTEMAICCIYYIASFNHGCVPAFEREIYGIELPNWVKSRCRRREWPWIWLRLSVQHEK